MCRHPPSHLQFSFPISLSINCKTNSEEKKKFFEGEPTPVIENHLGWKIQFGFDMETKGPQLLINGVKINDKPVAGTATNEHKTYNEEKR